MLNTKRCILVVMATALTVGVACSSDDEPTGPVAGTLVLDLSTPNTDDGAILVRISGPNITQVERADPSHYLHFVQDGSSLTAVVVGDLEAGDLLEFNVPDLGAAASYSATVQEVADRANALRGSLSGYELTVDRASG